MDRSGIIILVFIALLGTGAYFYFSQDTTVAINTASPTPAAGGTGTIRFSVDDGPNINRLSQIVAERKGFFVAEGLNVEFVGFTPSFRAPAGGAAASQQSEREAIESGSIQMSRQQLPLLMSSSISGERARASIGVGLEVSNSVYFLVVRPEITSYEDLRGKSVAITGPHDGITLWTYELMEQNGLGMNDYQPTRIAGTGARLECLRSGECAAASVAQPQVFGALDEGFHLLGVTNEIGPLLYQLDVADPAWASANRDTVVKYIRAIGAANQFILDPNNREEMVQITMDYMQEPEDRTRQMLSYIWDPANRVIQLPPVIDMDNVRATTSLFGKYGILPEPLPIPESYVDTSYAEAAGQ